MAIQSMSILHMCAASEPTHRSMRDMQRAAFMPGEVSERGEMPAAGAVHIMMNALRSVSLLEGVYDKLRRMHASLERSVYPAICKECVRDMDATGS